MVKPGPIRILLIDDDEDDFLITQDLLADLNDPFNPQNADQFQLEWISTYDEALAAIANNRHDVYLVDYRLGRHNGLDFIREAIRRGCSNPLILLTGQGDRAVDIEAMRAGVADYLVKGKIDASVLERSIRYAIERQRAAEEIQRRNRELALFNHIIAASAAGQDSQSILEMVCRELTIAFGVSLTVAFLFNEEQTAANLVVRYNREPASSSPQFEIPITDNPLFRFLLAHKAPLVVADALTDTRFAQFQDLLQLRNIQSFLLVPLIINDAVVGAIVFCANQPRNFSTPEINLAWSLADHVSGAMERTRLTQSHQRLITAIEQSEECVIITDVQGVIHYVNPAFEHITGYTRQEAVGQSLENFTNVSYNDSSYQNMLLALRNGQVWRGRFVNQRKDGQNFTEEAIVSPVRNEQGAIVNYVHLKHDVTRQLQLEDQLRQSQKMDAIGQLAGGVAHDFNNLLTAIMSYSSLALEALPSNHPIYSDLQGIQKTTERAAALTRQLLAFARQQITQPRFIDLNESIMNMNRLLRRLIGADIELVTLPGESLGWVKIDPSQIEQVLVNLVVNARDAMPNGGKLTIETANVELDEEYTSRHAEVASGSYVMLAISDNGIGMTKEVQAHIFEPFFTTKEVGKGTGLGLATCFGIVKQSGGHIWVYSEPGHGTTFKVYLPQGISEDMALSSRSSKYQLPSGTETVLLVEDETTVRDLAARVLRQRGYTVLEAANGEEALRILENRGEISIHLLLTDVVMPRMGGRALVNQLRSTGVMPKVLFMSGYTDNAVIQNDILSPNVDFLQKPFTPEQLAHKVRAVLNDN